MSAQPPSGGLLSPRAMMTWRARVYELDAPLVWALVSEGERQRVKAKSWVLSLQPSLSDNEEMLEAVCEFVLSLRSRALNQVCAQFLGLRVRNVQQIQDIHFAARILEKEFSLLVESDR